MKLEHETFVQIAQTQNAPDTVALRPGEQGETWQEAAHERRILSFDETARELARLEEPNKFTSRKVAIECLWKAIQGMDVTPVTLPEVAAPTPDPRWRLFKPKKRRP